MADEVFRRKAENWLWGLFGRRVLYAGDLAAHGVRVTLGLEEVTTRYAACCVPTKQWKGGPGWVDLVGVDDDGQPVIERQFGVVMWYREAAAGVTSGLA